MRHFNKKALTQLDSTSPTTLYQSIQTCLLQGDTDIVLRWLHENADAVNESLVQYIWMQSIRNNQTSALYPWLEHNHSEQLTKLHVDSDMLALLSSPRAWPALKLRQLLPHLDMAQIAHLTKTWSKQMQQHAKDMHHAQFRKERGPYFNECAAIQLDLLRQCVPSYRARATLLFSPMRQYTTPDSDLAYEGTSNVMCQMHRAYAQAMLQESNPNIWMLVALEKKQAATAYYLSCSPAVSAWWWPFLERVFHRSFDKSWWQQSLPKSTQELPQSLSIAANLADASTKIRHISSMLNFVDMEKPTAQETFLDIPSEALDME